jgi:hypothetical protein
MAFISKKRKVAQSKVDAAKQYSLKEASALVKARQLPASSMLQLICISV